MRNIHLFKCMINFLKQICIQYKSQLQKTMYSTYKQPKIGNFEYYLCTLILWYAGVCDLCMCLCGL